MTLALENPVLSTLYEGRYQVILTCVKNQDFRYFCGVKKKELSIQVKSVRSIKHPAVFVSICFQVS